VAAWPELGFSMLANLAGKEVEGKDMGELLAASNMLSFSKQSS
jgi:hypothetical protein